MNTQVIHVHRQAPAKPALGEPCNGCGLCCATEPCPIGIVISRRRTGACAALEWDDVTGRSRCGLLRRAAATGPGAQRLVARWIGAGIGCDAELDVQPTAAETTDAVS